MTSFGVAFILNACLPDLVTIQNYTLFSPVMPDSRSLSPALNTFRQGRAAKLLPLTGEAGLPAIASRSGEAGGAGGEIK